MRHLLELDAQLAQLLGYLNIEMIDVSASQRWVSAFPPGHKLGSTSSAFDRVIVPAWCCINNSVRDTGAIIYLMAEYDADVEWRGACVRVSVQKMENHGGKPEDDDYLTAAREELLSKHPDKQTALRVAVVRAVITLLET